MNANVFLTVAQEGSFRKAADALGYTQAGISYIISTMEELTGLCLFIRRIKLREWLCGGFQTGRFHTQFRLQLFHQLVDLLCLYGVQIGHRLHGHKA